jgi:hypothetical protein
LLANGSVKYICPFIARQQLGKHVRAATNTRISRRIIGRVSVGLLSSGIVTTEQLGNDVPAAPQVLFEAPFSVRSASYQRKIGNSSRNFLFVEYFEIV